MTEVSEDSAIAALEEHAPALVPLATRDETLLRDVLARPLDRPDDAASFRRAFRAATADLGDGDELRRVLRRLRHRGVVRIALREVLRLADVDRTSAEMAWLAAAAIDAALSAVTRTVVAEDGEPVGPDGARVPLTVLGMGKLGGGELNIGSDVDLIFFYETDEATVTGGSTTVHEVYARVASRATKALADVTEDGFVFRVDLRLRPEGSRGPLVNSLASAERYYETWGRTWERAALLRARPIAGDLAFGEHLLEVLRPFVYRRAVDPGIATEMAEMLRKARRDLGVDEARDVKLGRGGIREAEFFVQTLQLIWGGRYPELRVAGTIDAVRRLVAAGLLSDREARDLETAWALLRRIEHRIHVQAGYQTHDLPRGPDREPFARSLGFADAAALSRGLESARATIARLFSSLGQATDQESPELVALCDRVASGASAREIADELGGVLVTEDPDEAASHLVRLGRRATSPLHPVTRERMPELGPMLLREIAATADPDMALRYTADFFARLGGGGWDRLLAEEPRLVRRLVGLFGASATLSTALIRHPEAVEETLLRATPEGPDDIASAHAHLAAADHGADAEEATEAFVRALRRAKRETTLHVGLAFVAGDLDLEGVTVRLTRLADEQIRAAFAFASAREREVAPTPAMVVAGLGKLGGQELGFGGDLDLVFLYGDGADPAEAEVCTRVAQRTMRLLSQPDVEGRGYETDTRLRPSGSQGMLVVSTSAFDRYHESRAAPWERQALVRARPVAGAPELSAQVASRFAYWAFEHGPIPNEEVARMRRRIETELAFERPDRYHPKLGWGGLVDAEFVVQSLQIRHGADERVRSPNTLAALAALSATGHLSVADAEGLEEGYRFFRAVEQALALLDETHEPALFPGSRVADRVARRIGLRDRDGQPAREVLVATWRRRATELRSTFERLVAPIGTEPPWGAA